MVTSLLAHTPAYAYVILAILVVLGLMALRDRRLSLRRLILGPLLFAVYSLYSVATSYQHPQIAVLCWLAAVIGGMTVAGWLLPPARGATYAPQTRLFALSGSPVPLMVMMLTYGANYAMNAVKVISPELANDQAFTALMSALLGLCLGILAGRIAAIARLASRAFRAAPETA